MIEVIRNDNGDIVAICEWLLFNTDKQLDDNGTIIFVAEMEINKAYRGNGVVKKFIRQIGAKCPQAENVFFYREYKYPGRTPRIYKYERLLKRGK